MIFYLGTHMVNHASAFSHSFISANRLWNRKSHFPVNKWIMDSGAFSEISKFKIFRHSLQEYAALINRFSDCGALECAVTQDMMCEPFIVQFTGLSVKVHQQVTIYRYDELIKLTAVPIMPVIQGFAPGEYLVHLLQYGDRLKEGMRVGVGSICKRNSKPTQIEHILSIIKEVRPDLRLHGFGLKITALQNDRIRHLLYSADSMAWSYRARKMGGNSNGKEEATQFKKIIETMPIQGMLGVL